MADLPTDWFYSVCFIRPRLCEYPRFVECYRSRFLHPNRADCVMAIAERDRERAHA